MDDKFEFDGKFLTIKEFNTYLESLENKERIDFNKRILNTNKRVFAIKSKDIDCIVKNFSKGNFLQYLSLKNFESREACVIYGKLLLKLNFESLRRFLFPYLDIVDSWEFTDICSFKINVKERVDYFNLAKELIKSNKIFYRRFGIRILFSLVKFDDLKEDIYKTICGFYNEKEYYVNMILAWLLCELFIKDRNNCINFLSKNGNRLNSFVRNKFVSKCRDSFRVSKEDKKMLLRYKA